MAIGTGRKARVLICQLNDDVSAEVKFEFISNIVPIMEIFDAACYLTYRIKHDNRKAVVDHVKRELGVDPSKLCTIICSGRDLCPEHEGCFSLQEFYVRLGSALNLFRKNASFLGSDDQLITLQLCIAELNKQNDGKFDVLASDVLYHDNRMTTACLTDQPPSPIGNDLIINDLYLEYLTNTNTMDMREAYHFVRKYLEDATQREAILGNLTFVIFDLPEEPLQKAMLELLVGKKRAFNVTLGTTLDNSLTSKDGTVDDENKLQFEIKEMSLEDSLTDISSPCKSPTTESVTQLHVERAIMAYFRIIVNTRDEIALATALSSMTQVFSHQAFTALKNKAKAANLSMYQMAVSLITRMKLGGKGYAPDPNSLLMPFLPEISAFIELTGKIQNIIEEDLDTKKAIARIIKMVKGHITKTCNPKLLKKIIESAATKLDIIAETVVDQNLLPFSNNLIEAEKNSSVIGQHTINTMRHVVNIHNAVSSFGYKTQVLSDCFTSQSTPIRLPSLISHFRSPDCDEDNADDPKPLMQRLKNRKLKARRMSDNSQNLPSEISKMTDDDSCCTTATTPLKAIEDSAQMESISENGIETKNNHENTPAAKKGLQLSHRTVKRVLLTKDDEQRAKTKKVKAARKPTIPKGKQQLKGQQLMTRFLKV